MRGEDTRQIYTDITIKLENEVVKQGNKKKHIAVLDWMKKNDYKLYKTVTGVYFFHTGSVCAFSKEKMGTTTLPKYVLHGLTELGINPIQVYTCSSWVYIKYPRGKEVDFVKESDLEYIQDYLKYKGFGKVTINGYCDIDKTAECICKIK